MESPAFKPGEEINQPRNVLVRRAAIAAPRRLLVLVAVQDGQVLGLVKLVPASLAAPKVAPAVTHVQEIRGFSVAPEHQGRGVGTALLHAVRQEAAARGARRITLRVLGTNNRAQALYRRHGYQVEGTLRGELFLRGKYVDDVLMALDL